MLSEVKYERTGETAPKHPPENFRCENASSSAITCFWDTPTPEYASGVVQGFRLTYKIASCKKAELPATCDDTTTLDKTINDGAAVNYTFNNLYYFSDYDFQIQLLNRINGSPFSDPVRVETNEETPSSTPTNVVVYPYNTSSIILWWDPLPYGTVRGRLVGYVCYYRKISDFNITRDDRTHLAYTFEPTDEVQTWRSRQRRDVSDVTGFVYISGADHNYTIYDDRYESYQIRCTLSTY